jgi:hypothetical protein
MDDMRELTKALKLSKKQRFAIVSNPLSVFFWFGLVRESKAFLWRVARRSGDHIRN